MMVSMCMAQQETADAHLAKVWWTTYRTSTLLMPMPKATVATMICVSPALHSRVGLSISAYWLVSAEFAEYDVHHEPFQSIWLTSRRHIALGHPDDQASVPVNS